MQRAHGKSLSLSLSLSESIYLSIYLGPPSLSPSLPPSSSSSSSPTHAAIAPPLMSTHAVTIRTQFPCDWIYKSWQYSTSVQQHPLCRYAARPHFGHQRLMNSSPGIAALPIPVTGHIIAGLWKAHMSSLCLGSQHEFALSGTPPISGTLTSTPISHHDWPLLIYIAAAVFPAGYVPPRLAQPTTVLTPGWSLGGSRSWPLAVYGAAAPAGQARRTTPLVTKLGRLISFHWTRSCWHGFGVLICVMTCVNKRDDAGWSSDYKFTREGILICWISWYSKAFTRPHPGPMPYHSGSFRTRASPVGAPLVTCAPPRHDPYLPSQLLEAGDMESSTGPSDDSITLAGRQGRDEEPEKSSSGNYKK